jgi:hypothetical protein
MDSNLNRNSGWFAGFAVRTLLGISLLTGCITTVAAQENSGLITGVVTDATGAGVPAATVSAITDLLPKGIETQSDAQGKYILPRLPIGIYSVTVTKPGFSKLVQRNIDVKLGSQIDFNPKLAVGAVAEVVEVTDSAVSLDVTSSKTSTNISAATFDALPRGRNFHTLLAMAPGVRQEPKNGTATGAASGGGFQVDGASGAENAFLIDGVDVSDIRRGSLRAQNSIPFEFIQEIQIKSGGFEAEFGGATGGVVNVATKSGTNDFHGVGFYQFSNDNLNPRPRGYWQRSPANANLADFFAQNPKDDYSDRYPGFTLSGPIVKNSLFFTAGYAPSLTETTRTVPYASGSRDFNRTDKSHYGFSRLDYNPFAKLQTYASWTWSPFKQNGVLPNADPRVAAPTNDLSIQGGWQPAQTVTVGGTYSITSKWLVTARFGSKYQNDKNLNYGLSGAPYLQYQTASSQSPLPVPPAYAGANGYRNVTTTLGVVKDITTRRNIYVDSSYIANLAGRQHIFKFGYYQARVSNDVSTDFTNGSFQLFWGDKFSRGSFQGITGNYGYYIWQDGVRNLGDVNSRNQGFYLQDQWRVHRNVTLNVGVRLENEFLPPYKKEVNGKKVANPVSFDWGSKIAPRIGGAWDIMGDGKWKLAGTFGLFYDVLKYELARGAFGSDYWVSHVYKLDNPNVLALGFANPGAGGEKITQYDNRSLPINDAGEIAGIDPNIKPYTSREYSGTLSRAISDRLVFTARYIRKDLLKAIEDIGVLDAEESEQYVIGNPGFGLTRSDPNHVYDGKTPNGNFLVPKAVRQYDAVEMRLDGRYFNRINGMMSYTWSRLHGNYSGAANSDESGRSDPGVSRAFDLPYYYFDATGSQENVLGRLGTDRPHTLKIFASYDQKMGKLGTGTIGWQQFAWSGTPDTTSVIYLSAPTSPYGRADLGRTPAYVQSDISYNHSIKLSERFTTRLEANISNLFNQASVISRTTQFNRVGAIGISTADFFKGYDPRTFVTAGGTIPLNPIYNMPGGTYNNGGSGAYQAPRNIRLGIRLVF